METSGSVIKGKLPQLAELLQELAGIPYDVTFKISSGLAEESAGVEESEGKEEMKSEEKCSGEKSEIKAHKYILAASSSVFKSMFFGPMKTVDEVVKIEETTFEAFKKLIEYIYQVDIECKDMDLYEFFDIVNLAELYNLPTLTEELKIQGESIPLSMDNLMEVALIANEYSQFKDISHTVLMSCAKYLQKSITNPADQLQFALGEHANGNAEIAMELLRLVKQLPPLEECSNCGGKGTCLVGQGVPHNQMKKGLKMKVEKYYSEFQRIFGQSVSVSSVGSSGQVTVMVPQCPYCGVRQGHCGHQQQLQTYNSTWDDCGVPKLTFRYDC